ncbi:unnamed protein product [Mesocestoides corti]|uniref:Protein aurora borealis n=1 Tax=Mesocestoides corti TaxID=53468 RepID=A0A0R3U3Q5_MESCO|nr:unnamed protein product [Mesocestoides corti]
MNEENSELEVETPTKPCTYPALTTPSGGSVYHPFHEGYISRLGQVTVTPGLFASHTGGAKTPSKREAIPPNPFVWSPEVQGDLFPTEIDENPTAQLKLQRMLDADVSGSQVVSNCPAFNFAKINEKRNGVGVQDFRSLLRLLADIETVIGVPTCTRRSQSPFLPFQEDDAAQSKIRTFFHCNVIAPSPEGSVQQSKATLASKAAGKAEHEAIMMADGLVFAFRCVVEVQTAVSIAPDTDLVSLLQKVLQLNEPGSSPSVGCAAHESPGIAFFEAGAQQVKQPYPHSSLFLCVSCHQAHSLNRYSRRSMFIEAASMETIKDVPHFASWELSYGASTHQQQLEPPGVAVEQTTLPSPSPPLHLKTAKTPVTRSQSRRIETNHFVKTDDNVAEGSTWGFGDCTTVQKLPHSGRHFALKNFRVRRNSSEDNSSSQDVLYQSARETLSTQREEVEDAETFAEDFGLPVSWATEAVVCSYSQQDASMQEVDQPTSRPHHCSGTDLTELFDRADITPIKNLSHCLGTSHHLDPVSRVSPVAAGRTSPEAGAFQQHLQLSFTVDDESTRDACGIPQRRRQGSRQQAMLSPRLSPIPRASGHSPMDDEFGYSNDYDFSD